MKSPSFQFYPSDWLASQRVQLMSLEEEGAYVRLLCYCWNHGRIPCDPDRLARIIGKGASTTLATTVSTMFQPDAQNDGWMIHERLEAEREKQRRWKQKSSEGGRKSAEKREKSKGGSTTVAGVVEKCLPNGTNQRATLQSSSSNILPKSRKKEVSEDGLRFAEWFYSLLPDGQKLEKNWKQNWAECYDLMLSEDKRTKKEIQEVCRWGRNDAFWASNFLSPLKLRKRDGNGTMYYDVFKTKTTLKNGKAPSKLESEPIVLLPPPTREDYIAGKLG